MKNIVKNKGITLLALIITIIILLILAGISIVTLSNSSLFDKVKEAKGKYEVAKKEEEDKLKTYTNQIDLITTRQLTDKDINKPNTWPLEEELNFGDGIYGQRLEGNMSANSKTRTSVEIGRINCNKNDWSNIVVLDYGGSYTFSYTRPSNNTKIVTTRYVNSYGIEGANNTTSTTMQYYSNLNVSGDEATSNEYMSISLVLYNNTFSMGFNNVPYNIWILYSR